MRNDVGYGYWGLKVLRAAASLPEIEVAALVDFDRSLAIDRSFGRGGERVELLEVQRD
jgi:hypothetical protein